MKMSKSNVDLNHLPDEGYQAHPYEYTGYLFKEKLLVSPVAVKHVPVKLPDHLTFSKMEYASMCPLTSLPFFELHPFIPPPHRLSSCRRDEWRKFLIFLYDYDKVVPIIVDGWELFIKPPSQNPRDCKLDIALRVCYRKCSGESVPSHGPLKSGVTGVRGSANDSGEQKAQRRHDSEISKPKRARYGQMHPSYLATLAQVHASWQFGALAELVDNARDAFATNLNISISMVKMKGKSELIPMLVVEDNGRGMTHEEIDRMLQFGHKSPTEEDEDHIGHFGVGFKSGSMRLGKDVLILTQSKDSRSIGLLSTAYNAEKEVMEIPIVTYRKVHGIMELDTSVQSTEQGEACLRAVKKFSPFNEFEIGSFFDRIGDGNEQRNGTIIFIYNLDKWGQKYALQWDDDEGSKRKCSKDRDILIRSGRVRARPGQTSQEIPLDYSLRAYLEVLFLDPRMIIKVQGCKVKTTRLAQALHKTSRRKGTISEQQVELHLGQSAVEFNRGNCGIFLYWHGRLIEAYKRVGGMLHSADVGRGVIGVIDVTNLKEDDEPFVLNTKQAFKDCSRYAELEQWLANEFNDYWNQYFDNLEVTKEDIKHSVPDRVWAQCDKCRKWRKLPSGVRSKDLPDDWFCYMPPYGKTCSEPEEKAEEHIVTVGVKRNNTPAVRIVTPKVEVQNEDDDSVPTVIKRHVRKSASAVKVPIPTVTPTAATPLGQSSPTRKSSPIRKRLRKRT